MCINPSNIWIQRGPKWEQTPVACRQCWRCKRNRVNDYVARAMCEASTSEVTATITLTYAPRDDLADKILHPRHFQLFMKLLRRAGHEVRYLVAGEYGDLRGRAHFHAILFFKHLAERPEGAEIPAYGTYDAPFCREIPQTRMVHIREWPHGHVNVDWSASEKSARYVCKYLLAENKNNAWFSLSKKPALGAEWFAAKAAQARELGVLPWSFEYQPPGSSREQSYLVTGATRRDYLNAITTDPSFQDRMSEWVGKTFDKYQRKRVQDLLDNQSPEVLYQAFMESRHRTEEIQESERRFEERRFVDFLDQQIALSENGILRELNGKWVPEAHALKGETND